MPSETPRRRTVGAGRIVVTVAAPDGDVPPQRGLGAWLERTAPVRARGEVTVALVSDGRMRALNRTFRGLDAPTDVLSFPAGMRGCLGDIVIATGVARRQAGAAGHSVGTELRLLALHGLLHLLGYDHETDAGRMARAEARLRRRGGLVAGLIERQGRGRAASRRRTTGQRP